jgi:adenine-specific DNA-methyltransferase
MVLKMEKDEKFVELLWRDKHMKTDPSRKDSPYDSNLRFTAVEIIGNSPTNEDGVITPSEENWKNRLIWGDNKQIMSSLLKQGWAGKIDLIYIDPPFFTGADFSFTTRLYSDGQKSKNSIIGQKAYSDSWDGGISSYLMYMHDRLKLMKDLLRHNGSIYIHLDWRVVHYVKIMCDEIFGYDNFVNEIIWKKTNSPKSQSNGFGSQHDTLLVYSKSGNFRFKAPYREFDHNSLKPYCYDDGDGNGPYRLIEIEAQGVQRTPNRKQFEFRGRTAPYLYNINTLKEWDSLGLIYKTANGRYCRKQYLKEMKGIPVSDIWVDKQVSPIQSAEKVGYDTQKPEGLLRRIIETSTNEGDVVADFFSGSGTTLSVAEKLGRKWIGSDLSIHAINTVKKRLLGIHDSRNLNAKKYGKQVRPFEILKTESCETEFWKEKPAEYISFMTKLYNSRQLTGYNYIQASRENRAIFFGPVNAPVSMDMIKNFVSECVYWKFSGGDILGWTWDQETRESAKQFAQQKGVDLRLIQIPDVNAIKSALAGSDSCSNLMGIPDQIVEKSLGRVVKFRELPYVQISSILDGREITLKLEDFQFPLTGEESQLLGNIDDSRQLIDYWSVDWDYNGRIFHNQWQSCRTKKELKLELTAKHTYEDRSEHTIMVNVVDVTGNEINRMIRTAV